MFFDSTTLGRMGGSQAIVCSSTRFTWANKAHARFCRIAKCEHLAAAALRRSLPLSTRWSAEVSLICTDVFFQVEDIGDELERGDFRNGFGRTALFEEKLTPILNRGLGGEQSEAKKTVRPDVAAREKNHAARASHWRQLGPLAMPHMRWQHGYSCGHASTDYALMLSPMSVVRAWPVDRCSNKDAGNRESKSQCPCGD